MPSASTDDDGEEDVESLIVQSEKEKTVEVEVVDVGMKMVKPNNNNDGKKMR